MVSEQELPEEAGAQGDAAHEGDVRLRRRRKSRSGSKSRRHRRNQAKFPRLVRLALWLGLPIVLWSALYVAISLFEP